MSCKTGHRAASNTKFLFICYTSNRKLIHWICLRIQVQITPVLSAHCSLLILQHAKRSWTYSACSLSWLHNAVRVGSSCCHGGSALTLLLTLDWCSPCPPHALNHAAWACWAFYLQSPLCPVCHLPVLQSHLLSATPPWHSSPGHSLLRCSHSTTKHLLLPTFLMPVILLLTVGPSLYCELHGDSDCANFPWSPL